MPRKMRFCSGFLGLCSLSLVIDTLVNATCKYVLNNEDILPKAVWTFLHTLSYAMELGMYAQFFTMFVNIAIRPGSPSQNLTDRRDDREEGRPEHRGNAQEEDHRSPIALVEAGSSGVIDCQRSAQVEGEDRHHYLLEACRLVICAICLIIPATAFVLSTIYVVLSKKENFENVIKLQIALHSFLIPTSITLLVMKRCRSTATSGDRSGQEDDGLSSTNRRRGSVTTSTQESPPSMMGKVCILVWNLVCWLFIGDPERLIYVLYFSLGAWGYNFYDFYVYHAHGDVLGSEHDQDLGQAEAGLGLFSSFFVFLVVLFLKLRHAPVDGQGNSRAIASNTRGGHAITQASRQHSVSCKTFLLMFLLSLSVSLAIVDVVKEDYDQHEQSFMKNNTNLFLYYDLLSPLATDFRLHTAVMVFCVLLDDRLERKKKGRPAASGVNNGISHLERRGRDTQYGSTNTTEARPQDENGELPRDVTNTSGRNGVISTPPVPSGGIQEEDVLQQPVAETTSAAEGSTFPPVSNEAAASSTETSVAGYESSNEQHVKSGHERESSSHDRESSSHDDTLTFQPNGTGRRSETGASNTPDNFQRRVQENDADKVSEQAGDRNGTNDINGSVPVQESDETYVQSEFRHTQTRTDTDQVSKEDTDGKETTDPISRAQRKEGNLIERTDTGTGFGPNLPTPASGVYGCHTECFPQPARLEEKPATSVAKAEMGTSKPPKDGPETGEKEVEESQTGKKKMSFLDDKARLPPSKEGTKAMENSANLQGSKPLDTHTDPSATVPNTSSNPSQLPSGHTKEDDDQFDSSEQKKDEMVTLHSDRIERSESDPAGHQKSLNEEVPSEQIETHGATEPAQSAAQAAESSNQLQSPEYERGEPSANHLAMKRPPMKGDFEQDGDPNTSNVVDISVQQPAIETNNEEFLKSSTAGHIPASPEFSTAESTKSSSDSANAQVSRYLDAQETPADVPANVPGDNTEEKEKLDLSKLQQRNQKSATPENNNPRKQWKPSNQDDNSECNLTSEDSDGRAGNEEDHCLTDGQRQCDSDKVSEFQTEEQPGTEQGTKADQDK